MVNAVPEGFLLDFVLINPYKMDAFLKKIDKVEAVDISKLNMFLLKEKVLEFTRIKSENPNFTQGQICKMMGISDSTMRKVRNDLGIPSPFRNNTQQTKSKNTKSKNTQFQTKSKNTQQTESKNTQQTESKNTESKNNEVDKKISKFKNISRDYLASGIEDEEDTEEEEIKTENQMNRLFQK